MPRRNQNLTKDEAETKRQIAAALGLTATSGPHAGNGSALQLDQAILQGLAFVELITEDTAAFLSWLNEQRQTLARDSPEARYADRLIAALWSAQTRLRAPQTRGDDR